MQRTITAAASEGIVSTPAQHTPGPWAIEGAAVKASMVSATLKSGRRVRASIAVCKDNDGAFEIQTVAANARLIAAAPDMHAALRNALWLLKALTRETDELAMAVRRSAETALAKAEGR